MHWLAVWTSSSNPTCTTVKSLVHLSFTCFLFALIGMSACAPDQAPGLTVTGKIDQAGEMSIFLDRLDGPGAATEPLAKTTASPDGEFSLNVPTALTPGAYRLRIGARKLPLILDGDERNIRVESTLDDLQRYQYTVSGAGASHSFQALLGGLASRTYKSEDVSSYVDTVGNPYAAAYAAELSLGPNGKFIDTHKRALARLEEAQPGSSYGTRYADYINKAASTYAAQQATQRIKVGEPAPDITLPDPDGKQYSLSDLKGNIVLLDFWASWCGPCRRENPNVVKVYDQYKDQGFTVFSVSLDGLDTRSRQRLQGEEQIAQQMKAQKNRWTNAIAQDQLKWPYHVSDLRKWETLPAKAYGVSSIPRTFLIDRDGKIAAVNPRGAGVLERELKKLL